MILRLKILLPLAGAGLLMAAYISLVARPLMIEQQRAEHMEHLHTHLDTLALAVAYTWEPGNARRAAGALDATLAHNPNWQRLDLRDIHQRLLHTVRAASGVPDAQGWIPYTRAVWVKGREVGTITLWYDLAPDRQVVEDAFWRFQLVVWSGGLLLLGSLALLFEWWIHRPLTRLREAAAGFARGDDSVALPTPSRDEVGELVRVFAGMRATLSANQDATLEAYHSVDRQVRERTRELQHQQSALDMHAIVAITDPAGRITYVNDKFCEISQYSRAELIGRNHRLLNSGHHPREFFVDMWRTISGGQPWNGDICNRRKDGSLYWVSSTIVPFVDEAGRPYQYVAIRTDITWRKQVELELAHARDDALAASEAKSEFLSVISHEIRTPLNGVIGVLGLMKRWQLEPNQQRYLDAADHSAHSLLAMLNQMLDFTRLDAERVALEKLVFNPHDLLEHLSQVYHAKAEMRGLRFEAKADNSVPAAVIGDPNRTRQILANLLDNAIKFTDHGRVTLTLSGVLQTDGDVRLRMEVCDSGVGIPDDARERIFEAFTQADSSTTRRYGGTGLGLAIVTKLVRLMGGTIAVRSPPSGGSCFTVEAPFSVVATPADTSQTIASTA